MAESKRKSQRNGFLNFVYIIFLALLVALFWGMGISAFYPAPKAPDSNAIETEFKAETPENSAELTESRRRYEAEQKEYQEKQQTHNRNVSILALSFAVLTLVGSLLVAGRVIILPDGLLLGSLFTLAYSIIRGFASEDAKFRFVIVAIGLAVTVFVGYWKFIKESKDK